jgi:hypothetical protein
VSDLMIDGTQTEAMNHGILLDGTGGGGGFHQSDLHIRNSIIDGGRTDCINMLNFSASNESSVEINGGWCEAIAGLYGVKLDTVANVDLSHFQFVPNGGMTTSMIYVLNSQYVGVRSNHTFGGWGTFRNSSSSLIYDGTTSSPIVGNSFLINAGSGICNVSFKNGSSSNPISGNMISGGAASNFGICADSTSNDNNYSNVIGTYTVPVSDAGARNKFLATIGTANPLTMDSSGAGAAPSSTFDGSAARTISYNSIGAAPLASPTLTGIPTVPTAAPGTSTTQAASTAFVQAAVTGGTLPPQASNTVLMNATGSPAVPSAVAMPTCTTGADLYNTTTHTWSCVGTGVGAVSGSLVLLESHTASASSTISFTSCLNNASYNAFLIRVRNTSLSTGATTGNALKMVISDNGGSSYLSASSYTWVLGFGGPNASASAQQAASTTSFRVGLLNQITAGVGDSEDITIYPGVSTGTGVNSPYYTVANGVHQDTGLMAFYGTGQYTGAIANPITAVQFSLITGTITSGQFTCYGIVN